MMPSTLSLFIKCVFDLTLAVMALPLPLLAIPMLAIAVTIRTTSHGPVLHWSDRVGRFNRTFRMPKFRTVRVDTPQLPTHAMKNPDAYLTAVGPFLRKTSLDELPQLFSILKGDLRSEEHTSELQSQR